MNSKTENVKGTTLQFWIMFTLTEDELWDWADNQSIATIHDISIKDDMVTILPLWSDDTTSEVQQAFQESLYDYFVEKMQ